MKWAIAEFRTESNTFSPVPITLDDFQRQFLIEGEKILQEYPGKNLEVAGFIEVAQEQGAEIVPLVGAAANPGGKVTNEAYEHIMDMLLKQLQKAGSIDGLLLSLHGSMVTEDIDDAEGAVLAAVRKQLGPEVLIVVTLDLHCNITREMVEMSDVIVPYRTCPHVDQAETGRRAAEILGKLIKNGIKPRSALRKPPMILQVSYATTGPRRKNEPFSRLIDGAAELEQDPRVILAGITGQQRTIDIAEMGPAVIVVTDDDQQLADQLADELSAKMWDMRHEFTKMPYDLKPPKEAIAHAMQIEGGPVLFVEYADTPTGGAPGDCVDLLRALIEADVDSAALAAVTDPAAVSKMIEAGVGNEVTLDLGGRVCTSGSQPLNVTGTVRTITDGRFVQKGHSGTGAERNMGRAVVLQVGGVRIIVNEECSSCVDPEIFRSMGIEPMDMKIVAAKCYWHLLANYDSVAKDIIFIDTPGMMNLDLSKFTYKKIRRPMFPLDPM